MKTLFIYHVSEEPTTRAGGASPLQTWTWAYTGNTHLRGSFMSGGQVTPATAAA